MATMIDPLRLLTLPAFCLLAIVTSSCGTSVSQKHPQADSQVLLEPQPPQTFLENYRELKTTTAYRQNIWLTWNHGQDPSQTALCVDLRNQVYLVIASGAAVRPGAELPAYYRNLSVPASVLRARMDTDAFVLRDNPPVIAIFRVPDNAAESFAVDAMNHVLGTHLTPESLGFQAD